MGIGAAIIGGAIVGGVGNYLGGKQQADATKDAGKANADVMREAAAMGDPWRTAGTGALAEQQQLMTPQGQAEFYQNYTDSPMFETERNMREEAYLRGASATGGLRTGQANEAFGNIAPQLANQAYTQRLQGLQGLSNLGASVSGQSAGTIAQSAPYAGQVAGAYNNWLPETLGQFGGLAMYSGMQPQAPMAPMGSPTLPNYSNQGAGRLA